jgi:hypothetical protein
MGRFQIILNTLALGALKPVVYRAQLRREPGTGGGAYPSQEGEETGNIVGGNFEDSPHSWLGTPVFSDVQFPQEGEETIKLETVLIDVSQTKNIVTTAVQGRNGTVKEYISLGDYEVRIRGAIVTERSDAYPYNQTRDFHKLLIQSNLLKVVAEYLRLFDIYSIVVKSFSFPQQEGFQNMQQFEINAISDSPDELIQEN